MKKLNLLLVIITIGCTSLRGQVSLSAYKEKTAQNVYLKLVEAFGDGRTAPELKFITHKNIKDSIVAAYVPGDIPTIEIEEIAYDVCASFGKDSMNALACVLGHELAHYYLKHDWCSNFSKRLSHISIAADLYKIDQLEQLKKESEADYSGFYFGSIAGYKTFDVAPALLKKIYSTYKLNASLKGYPTLKQRVEAAEQSKTLVLKRLPVFEAGVCLYEIGEFELAFDCFINLLSDFTSRENYNNAAVCKLQLALPLFKFYEMPFCFPFELDYNTRLAGGSSRSGSFENEREKKIILAEAKKLLEEGIRKDPSYSKAKINLAICYIMLDNIDMAAGVIKEMEDDSSSEIAILKSIIDAQRGNIKKALSELNNLTNNQVVVNHNKNLFELALKLNLPIINSELGYQIRKAGSQILSWSAEDKIIANNITTCFDSTSKKISAVTDSIHMSKSTLYFIKGDRNYIRKLIIKPKQGNDSLTIFFLSETNSCLTIAKNNSIFIDKGVPKNMNLPPKKMGKVIIMR